jgi:hypothetical protein
MALVDSYALQFEVEAAYPYSTYIVDTEEEVREKLSYEKEVHGVSCRVRAVGPWVTYYGDPGSGQ